MKKIIPILTFSLIFLLGCNKSKAFWGFGNKKEKPKLIPIITLQGEYVQHYGELGLFADKKSLSGLLKKFWKLERDPKVKGIIIRFGGLYIGLSTALDISKAIKKLSQKKPVLAYIEGGTPADYIAALGAKKIIMHPEGILLLPGFGIETMYFKRMLDKLGISADFITIGKYKTAPEPFTRDTVSDAHKTQLNRYLDDSFLSIKTYIAFNRKIMKANSNRKVLDLDTVQKAIDLLLHTSESALRYKLIDKVLTYDEVKNYAKNRIKGNKILENFFSRKKKAPTSIFSLFSMIFSQKEKKLDPKKPKIAVIFASGPIFFGSPPKGFFSVKSEIWSYPFTKMLEKISKLPNLKAIILRVNSPGGSALASDQIWNKITSIKKRLKIPVIVSMGDIAASGGYYISMAGDYIFAHPTTLTGSIGVFGGKLIFKEGLNKLGIDTYPFQRGKNSRLFSPFQKFNEKEREIFKKFLERVYKTFTEKAAKSRKMKLEKLLKVAGGRIWSGKDAVRNGLADKIGGLLDAIEYTKKKINTPHPLLLFYPQKKNLLHLLMGESQTSMPIPPILQKVNQKLPIALQKILPAQLQQIKLLFSTYPAIFTWYPSPIITTTTTTPQ